LNIHILHHVILFSINIFPEQSTMHLDRLDP
jgi:hypothetical protein